MTETLLMGTHLRVLIDGYLVNTNVKMFFKILCILVLQMKVATALEGLTIDVILQICALSRGKLELPLYPTNLSISSFFYQLESLLILTCDVWTYDTSYQCCFIFHVYNEIPLFSFGGILKRYMSDITL